jgi:hypothetical protein
MRVKFKNTMAINLLSHQDINTGIYKTTLVFTEDFITLEIVIQGFNSNEEAEEFAKLRWSLCLEGENLYLFFDNGSNYDEDNLYVLLDRNQVKLKYEKEWFKRIALDTADSDGSENYSDAQSPHPLVVNEDDLELVDWSFKELCEKILVDKRLKINQYLAYGIRLGASGTHDETLVVRWRKSKARLAQTTIA